MNQDRVWDAERMASMSEDEIAQRAELLTHKVENALHGNHPVAVGAALGQATAKWIAGHSPEVQEERLDSLIELVRTLYPEISAEIWPKGKPS